MKVRILSEPGESHPELEDFSLHDYNGTRLKTAVGDWASDQLGRRYRDEELSRRLGRSPGTEYGGGFIGTSVARMSIESTELTGHKLVGYINRTLAQKYEHLGISGYWQNRRLTFLGYIAHLLATPGRAAVTAIGDVKVAVDGRHVAGKTKKVDIVNSKARSNYIEETGDAEGGYRYVQPLILAQYDFQNSPGHPLSFPSIDGTETLPAEEIEVLDFQHPCRILMWSDGFVMPDEFTIEGLERKLVEAYEVDPYRYKEYPAVGYMLDDRTAVEITDLDDWKNFAVEFVSPSFRRK